MRRRAETAGAAAVRRRPASRIALVALAIAVVRPAAAAPSATASPSPAAPVASAAPAAAVASVAPTAAASPSLAMLPPDLPAATRRMAERLAQAALRTDPLQNPFANDARAAIFEKRLQEAPEATAAIAARLALATELLNAGWPERAIAAAKPLLTLGDAERAVAPPDLEMRVRAFLAMAHLRVGEQENCVARHVEDSCLFPIRGGGIHTEQAGSRAAMAGFADILGRQPDDLGSRWLLNVAAMTVGEYPGGVPEPWRIGEEHFASEHDMPRFYDRAAAAGVAARGHAGGVAMEDFDGDGRLDLMVSSMGMTDPLRFFHNDGDGRFSERTAAAELTGEIGGLNLVHADVDNDGDADVLVLRGGWMERGGHLPQSLLRNDGRGRFEDVTEASGLLRALPTQTAAFGDYDGDGWLDLFLGNESGASELLRNRGDGTFEPDSASLPRLGRLGYVKGAAFGDYDNDGRQDLYVSAFMGDNLLLHNDGPAPAGAGGRVRFTDVAAKAGVLEPKASFATWFWDFDNDGWLDLYVSGFFSRGVNDGSLDDVAALLLGLPSRAETPRLYRNQRDGTFADVTRTSRLDRVALVMGANYGDVDGDGRPDLYLGTGEPDLRTLVPNRLFRQSETGVFQDVTSAMGVGHLQKGHAVVFGDIDDDGDQDIYESMGGAFLGDVSQNVLYENPGPPRRWITLFLTGRRANRAGIGARIRVRVRERGATRDVHALAGTGGSFGSSSLRQEIGLGDAEAIESIEIVWPGSGTRQVFRDVPLDRAFRAVEGGDALEPVKLHPFALAREGSAHH